MAVRSWVAGVLASVLAALAAPAFAEPAYTAKTAHLRAGPGRSYPVVAILPPDLLLEVQGCLAGYTWCDVIAGRQRGWVYARNLWHRYGNADVPLLDHGAQIGIAIIGFGLLDYWHDHYRYRPWYGDRNRWADVLGAAAIAAASTWTFAEPASVSLSRTSRDHARATAVTVRWSLPLQ